MCEEHPATSDGVLELGRILVVEDQRMVAEVLRDLLGGLGYAVKITGTGEEALTLAPVYLAKPFGLQVLERVVAAAVVEHERRTQQPQG